MKQKRLSRKRVFAGFILEKAESLILDMDGGGMDNEVSLVIATS